MLTSLHVLLLLDRRVVAHRAWARPSCRQTMSSLTSRRAPRLIISPSCLSHCPMSEQGLWAYRCYSLWNLSSKMRATRLLWSLAYEWYGTITCAWWEEIGACMWACMCIAGKESGRTSTILHKPQVSCQGRYRDTKYSKFARLWRTTW